MVSSHLISSEHCGRKSCQTETVKVSDMWAQGSAEGCQNSVGNHHTGEPYPCDVIASFINGR